MDYVTNKCTNACLVTSRSHHCQVSDVTQHSRTEWNWTGWNVCFM